MDNSKTIYVYDNFLETIPKLMGYLYIDTLRGKELYSFEYNKDWLTDNPMINIDPDIKPFSGRQYSSTGKIFGVFADASPDRWGRTLMVRREKNMADLENRHPKKLLDSDYLLGVYDKARMGGIRLKKDTDGAFQSDDLETPIPAWTNLRTLEEASRHYEADDLILDKKWIDQLIRPGSSLGGARPKATIMDTNGSLWIAKFPSKNDDNNVGAWEKVASDLGKLINLNVPESKIENFSPLGSTFLVKRFDRIGEKRIHFASAMTLLGKNDGDDASYLDIASFIKSYGSNPKKDLLELWKRIVFYMAISNTDDHLRNHAFILDNAGWKLSPMFDVNPIPYGDELSLSINELDNHISFDLAIKTAPFFGIEINEAKKVVSFISKTVKDNWMKLAKQYGISSRLIEEMQPAFSECYKENGPYLSPFESIY